MLASKFPYGFAISRYFNVFLKRRSEHTAAGLTALEQVVPKSNIEPCSQSLLHLRDFVDRSHRLFVLTGAGISTESGIRDYRSEGVGLYAVSKDRPVQHQDFVKYALKRQRYWARNYAGWPIFSSFRPNAAHYVLAKIERAEKLHWLVTQNVDTLHSKAGSKRLTELHGATNRVTCLMCGDRTKREDLQKVIQELNPNFHASPELAAPDGDVLLHDDLIKGFLVPDCQICGGVLKPDVVFFGDSVPRDRVNYVHQRLKECDSILVLGSSLHVNSAYRFIVAAHELKIPLAIVNIGLTRADDLANLRVHCKIGEIVSTLNEFV